MTAYAYEQAARLPGLLAIEISVCLSADGVLVCSHDPTTERVTGVPYTIAKETWATLSSLKVTSAFTHDPSQPTRPLSRFDDVIEQHIDRLVAFVEPKTPDAVQPLMEKMASLNAPQRVVWKQPINQPNFDIAKSNGFATWGYVLNEPGHLGDNLRRFAAMPSIDMLGTQRLLPDDLLTPVVKEAAVYGKKAIMWNIRNAEDRGRALRLGCQGMMTSNIAEVPGVPL
jgi:glycerophosphoryl diester phosphodiesterase